MDSRLVRLWKKKGLKLPQKNHKVLIVSSAQHMFNLLQHMFYPLPSFLLHF